MNSKQIKTLAIILVAVIALSVGFAAFSATLNIESQAQVNPNSDDFSVKFSRLENTLDESDVIATNIVGENVEAKEAKIDNSNSPTITDLNVSFTSPGESVTYEFYVMNTGEYKAYLRDVEFKRSVNGVDFISCKAGTGATEELVREACKGINFELTIDNEVYTPYDTEVNQELLKGTSKKVTVKISYETGSALADGPFTVSIGNVALAYASTSTGEYDTPEIGGGVDYEEIVFDDIVTFTLTGIEDNEAFYSLDKNFNINLNNYVYNLTIDEEFQFELVSYISNIDGYSMIRLANYYEDTMYAYANSEDDVIVIMLFHGEEFQNLAGTHNIKITKTIPAYPHLLRIAEDKIEIISTEIEAVESVITVKDSDNNIILTETVEPTFGSFGTVFEISDSNTFSLLERENNPIVTVTQEGNTFILGGSEYEYIYEERVSNMYISHCVINKAHYYWGDNRKALWADGC